YGSGENAEPIAVKVIGVIPAPAGTVGSGTVVGSEGDMAPAAPTTQPEGHPAGEPVTTAVAMLTGLETELETLAGWLALLTSPGNLPGTWGLPSVAGVVLEGPAGVGKSELVNAAASAAGAQVNEISLELVFKPEKLLDLVEKGVKQSVGPTVIFLDRLDAVAGDEGRFRTQMGAILR
ncbi:MAG: AAA family ATPase, partial [bacterium]|nr:AAA family ATPase [bacterium]